MQEEFGSVAFDTLLAATESDAERAVLKVRGDRCTVSEVLRPKDFAAKTAAWAAETSAQCEASWRLTTWLRTESSWSAPRRKRGKILRFPSAA
jgi:hypothetical protein